MSSARALCDPRIIVHQAYSSCRVRAFSGRAQLMYDIVYSGNILTSRHQSYHGSPFRYPPGGLLHARPWGFCQRLELPVALHTVPESRAYRVFLSMRVKKGHRDRGSYFSFQIMHDTFNKMSRGAITTYHESGFHGTGCLTNERRTGGTGCNSSWERPSVAR